MDKALEWFFNFISPVLTFYPRVIQLVFASTLGLILISVFLGAIWYPSAKQAKEGVVPDSDLPRLMRLLTERNPGYPYVIEAVTMITRFEQASPTQRVADVRTIYTLFAIKDFTDDAFLEDYHSHTTKNVTRVPGSEPESDTEPAKWKVLVGAKKGQRRTLMTSVRFTYDVPFPVPGTEHCFSPIGGFDEERRYYPNDQDVIGQLTMIIESSTLHFSEPGNDDACIVNPPDPSGEKIDPIIQKPSRRAKDGWSVVTHRWFNVVPHAHIGLRARFH